MMNYGGSADGTRPANAAGIMRHSFPACSLARISLSVVLAFASSTVACGGDVVSTDATSAPKAASASSSADPSDPSDPTAVCEAFPVCDEGDRQVSDAAACEPGTACYERSICGSTIWCSGTTYCRAVPRCLPGFAEVGACPPGGSCTTVSSCGASIVCLDLATCPGLPSCDAGDTQVEKASACLQDDARCYPREACGARIWCTGPAN